MEGLHLTVEKFKNIFPVRDKHKERPLGRSFFIDSLLLVGIVSHRDFLLLEYLVQINRL